MLIKCFHGYYIFEETKLGQAADFMDFFGVELVRRDNYFTFRKLLSVDKYSLEGKAIGESIATVSFEGEPWEVLEANGLVYDFSTDTIVPIDSISFTAQIDDVGSYFVADGLLIAGTYNQFGLQVKGFMGWFLRDRTTWTYSEVSYE